MVTNGLQQKVSIFEILRKKYLFLHNLFTKIIKGRLEKDETDYDAAIRETQEETGLYINKDYDLIDSNYTIINTYKTSSNKNKRVVYWLAKVKDYNVVINLSNEHQSFKWMKINEIESLFNECEMTRACIEANDYLINLNK